MSASNGAATLMMFVVAGWLFLGDENDEHAKNPNGARARSPQVKTVSSSQKWSALEICGRAIQTYFFIVMPPRLIDVQSDAYTFESEAGHRYDCSLSGNSVLLDWINYTGDKMFSRSTSYSVGSDGKLTVTTLETTVSYSP